MSKSHDGYDDLISRGKIQELPAEELVVSLERIQRAEDMHKRRLAFYLVEMEERRVYESLGFRSTQHFAEERMDQSRHRTNELIHIGRSLRKLPEIDVAFCQSEISWTKLLEHIPPQ